MDILVPLILMLILYIIPELLKKGKNKGRYEYPDIPETQPEIPPRIPRKQKKVPVATQPDLGHDYYITFPQQTYEEHFKITSSQPVKPVVPEVTTAMTPPPVSMPVGQTIPSHLQGLFSPNVITTGIIFSEIIMPPRAYRPLGRCYNKKIS